jgi:hypothetical protein
MFLCLVMPFVDRTKECLGGENGKEIEENNDLVI